ncbi:MULTISPECIES: hypothetical protein [Bradyrhizobium]|uniref:hypothetical protein n=1 Tax=Bradyrhizobium TaxID=374 RepID=UPI0035E3881A
MSGNHKHTTVPEHMASSHQRYAGWTIERIRKDAAIIGPATAALCVSLLDGIGAGIFGAPCPFPLVVADVTCPVSVRVAACDSVRTNVRAGRLINRQKTYPIGGAD